MTKLALCDASSRPRIAVLLLGEDDNRAPFGRLVGERSELGGIGHDALADAGRRTELRRLPVAKRNGARLVEEQRVDVTRGFDGSARHRENVVLNQAIHAGDANGGDQRADGGRDETHEERDENGNRNLRPGVVGKRLQRHDNEKKNERQDSQQDVEGDFVGSFLTLSTFDECDHPVEERLARIRGNTDLYPI